MYPPLRLIALRLARDLEQQHARLVHLPPESIAVHSKLGPFEQVGHREALTAKPDRLACERAVKVPECIANLHPPERAGG